MERDIRKLTSAVVEQDQSIPYFKETNTPERIADMLVEEATELVSELKTAFITDDLTQVAGELGDVIYLALKMADTLGLNADEVVQMKILRNKFKYANAINGEEAKRRWVEQGGDEIWYQLYLESIAIIDNEQETE